MQKNIHFSHHILNSENAYGISEKVLFEEKKMDNVWIVRF